MHDLKGNGSVNSCICSGRSGTLHINNILTKNTENHLLPLPHDPAKRLNGGQVGAKKKPFSSVMWITSNMQTISLATRVQRRLGIVC